MGNVINTVLLTEVDVTVMDGSSVFFSQRFGDFSIWEILNTSLFKVICMIFGDHCANNDYFAIGLHLSFVYGLSN